ncbi:MAG: sigma-70 family RNA polymerase sigma factor [Clostridia bacterium]|nr:sigma-70 family RNA polymerase sigma factor [Clostridia bacterium]
MKNKITKPLQRPPEPELDALAAQDLDSHTDSRARKAADALVKKAMGGDAEAFGVLVETYEKFVYHSALRTLRMCGGSAEDGEDVAQNAFLKAWRSLSTFRGDCAFSTWLYRITVNCARDHCRMEARHPTTSLSVTSEDEEEMQIEIPVCEGDDVPESAIERRETIRLVREAIRELPEDMRTILVLRDMEELSYAEIADLLHLEVGTVKSRLNRARTALKTALVGVL